MRFSRGTLAIAAFTLIFGCYSDGGGPSGDEATATHDSVQVLVQSFEGRGLVAAVMPNKEHIVVDHEDIPGFMSAMRMPFALKDTSLVTGVMAGDSIRFTVEVDDPYVHLVRIEVMD